MLQYSIIEKNNENASVYDADPVKTESESAF